MITAPSETGTGLPDAIDRESPTIGVLGFGKVGTALARLARSAGYRVVAAASGDPSRIELIRDVLAPGVEVGWAEQVTASADILILALPLHARDMLPAQRMEGKILVDAMNHWPEVDGPRDDWVPRDTSTSEFLQGLLPEARVVKAFNHVGYRDLEQRGRSVAIAHASDDRAAAGEVATIIRAMGFAPVDLGALASGHLLEPGAAAFGAALPEDELRGLVESSRAAAAATPAA